MVASFHPGQKLIKGNGRTLGSQRVLFGPDTGTLGLSNIRWQERVASGSDGWRDLELDSPTAGSGPLDPTEVITVMESPEGVDTIVTGLGAAPADEVATAITPALATTEGAAAIEATPITPLPTAAVPVQTIGSKLSERVSPRDYGARGDGTARTLASLGLATSAFPDVPTLTTADQLDWAAIMQAQAVVAARGGGELDYGEGEYVCNKAIRQVSGVVHRGRGPRATRITNLRTSSMMYDKGGFIPGVTHPYAALAANGAPNIYPNYPCANVAQWADRVTLTTAANAGSVAVGAFVIVRSTAESVGAGYSLPDYMFFAKVLSSNAVSGLVVVDRHIPVAIVGASLSVVGGTDPFTGWPWLMIENAGAVGFSIDADNIWGIGGARSYLGEDMEAVGGQSHVWLNGMVESTFRHIRGPWSNVFIELKHGSWKTQVFDCVGDYRYDAAVTISAQAIALGESSWDITLQDIYGTMGVEYTPSFEAIYLSSGGNYILRNVNITALGPNMPYFTFFAGGARRALSVEGVWIEGGEDGIGTGGAAGISYPYLIGTPAAAEQPRRVHIARKTIRGAVKAGAGNLAIYSPGCTGLTVRGVFHPTGTVIDINAATADIADGNAAIT